MCVWGGVEGWTAGGGEELVIVAKGGAVHKQSPPSVPANVTFANVGKPTGDSGHTGVVTIVCLDVVIMSPGFN